ncbi:MAG: CPBP family intramembrane metalloprotease [Nocardioides sp.]|nr:CPBP family intramembrane metalloprotease [Nocardioides sp.]
MSDPTGLPATGLPYHRVLRGGRWAWWRALLGLLSVVGFIFVLQVVVVAIVGGYLAVTGTPLDEIERQLSGEGEVMPSYLTVVNLGWATAIPAIWLVVWMVHRVRPRWLASVAPRIRWRWFAVCLGLSMLALIATLVVAAFLPAADSDVSGELNDFTSRTRDFLLVVLLLTPLQAAGEEYAFRGYLTQTVGAWFPAGRVSLVAAVVLPSLLFALAHGAQDPPIFVDRLAFGLVAGTLVVLTGGLEAGIAMHVLNNFLAFGVALAYGDMTSALNPTGGTWWSLPVTLTQSLTYLAVVLWVARAMGLRTTSEQAVLEPIRPRM